MRTQREDVSYLSLGMASWGRKNRGWEPQEGMSRNKGHGTIPASLEAYKRFGLGKATWPLH